MAVPLESFFSEYFCSVVIVEHFGDGFASTYIYSAAEYIFESRFHKDFDIVVF